MMKKLFSLLLVLAFMTTGASLAEGALVEYSLIWRSSSSICFCVS